MTSMSDIKHGEHNAQWCLVTLTRAHPHQDPAIYLKMLHQRRRLTRQVRIYGVYLSIHNLII